jgi:hypothetical protein
VKNPRKPVNLQTPPVDPEKFLHTWRIACTAADGEVRPLRGIAGATVTLRDGRQDGTAEAGATSSRWRSPTPGVGTGRRAHGARPQPTRIAAEGQLQRWVYSTDSGPTIHEALIRGAAQARFTSHTGFDLADLEVRTGGTRCSSER